MKTQYYTAASLDGFIATSDHSLDWLMQFGSVEETSYPAFIKEIGAIAMGSSTYEWLLRHEIKKPEDWLYRQPAWVFSNRDLDPIPGADIRFASGDVAPVHRQMVDAAGAKNIWIVGGGDLAGQFHDQGLLDEIIVQIAPVTLGSGAPLLPRTIANPPMSLISIARYGEFAEIRYAVKPSRSGLPTF